MGLNIDVYHMRPPAGAGGAHHTYFYGDEKITEMEEDDRGMIALQFRAKRKVLYLYRYRWSFRRKVAAGSKDGGLSS